MAKRKESFAPGEYYHIYNRGNSKQQIFHDTEDYLRFMTLLYTCNSFHNFNMYLIKRGGEKDPFLFERGGQRVAIGAYTLMPNHFHIFIKETNDKGVSAFIQKLCTAYSSYYNKKYKRTGGLFEGKFKAEHVDNDVYLKYIFSYIHLNPLKLIQKDWKEVGIKDKDGAITYLSNYEYSSYKDYLGSSRKYAKILYRQDFPEYFPDQKIFVQNILSWISYKQEKNEH
jgi:putative transposase